MTFFTSKFLSFILLIKVYVNYKQCLSNKNGHLPKKSKNVQRLKKICMQKIQVDLLNDLRVIFLRAQSTSDTKQCL